MTGRTPARLLAPIALVTTALALFLILAGGDGGGGANGDSTLPREPAVSSPDATEGGDDDAAEDPSKDGRPRRKTYTVRPGDTPSGIAEEVGIPLEELLDLNPEVDPQTLSPGQKLRVR